MVKSRPSVHEERLLSMQLQIQWLTLQLLVAAMAITSDIFADPIGTSAPPKTIAQRKDHPVPRKNIASKPPISTNKFYANMFLGQQTSPTYLHPYSVAWCKGKGASSSWGMAISHIDAHQRVYGSTSAETGAAKFYLNPVGIQSLVVSAKELGSETILSTAQLTAHSVVAALRPNSSASPAIQFPLVQGSGFVTAIFAGACPLIQTGVFYKTVTRSSKEAKSGITKFRFHLQDGTTWLLYAYHSKGDALDLQVVNDGLAQAKGPFYGTIQIAKDPTGKGEPIYDAGCGAYPTDVTLSGSAKGAKASYTFAFSKGGMGNVKLLMFALPHHVSSFDDKTRAVIANGLTLQTTTKGMANAIVGDSWTMVEDRMPIDMGFTPWSPGKGSKTALSAATKAYIHSIAVQEVSQDIMQQTNQNSLYFSGKALAKFANIILVLNDLLGDAQLAATGLAQLKAAFARFTANQQQYPLVYESAWGGVVSSASYVTGNDNADFGNTYYNDHHFHYGYFIYTAAVIGHLDPSWIKANREWVNVLVRDVSNPSPKDTWFPVFRAFDWFHGHSWAHGLYESADGKDQESSSEDVMHVYAIKMWGQVTGDANMAARYVSLSLSLFLHCQALGKDRQRHVTAGAEDAAADTNRPLADATAVGHRSRGRRSCLAEQAALGLLVMVASTGLGTAVLVGLVVLVVLLSLTGF